MSSWDRSESQGLAADESCKDVLAKNRQAEQSGFPNGLPSSTGAEKTALTGLMPMQLGLSYGV